MNTTKKRIFLKGKKGLKRAVGIKRVFLKVTGKEIYLQEKTQGWGPEKLNPVPKKKWVSPPPFSLFYSKRKKQ